MKKKLFLGLLAAAAVSFTACQKDEVISEMPQDEAIGFGTYVGRDAMTKVASIDTEEKLQADTRGFGVFAHYTHDSEWDGTAATFTSNFMNNQQVKYATKWDYSPKKYWPKALTDKISFLAYYPWTESTTLNIGEIPFTLSNNIPEQIDLMYNTNENCDNLDKNSTVVSFDFGHALSRIGFKASAPATTADANTSITINQVTLTFVENTIYTTNNFNLVTKQWNSSASKATSPISFYWKTSVAVDSEDPKISGTLQNNTFTIGSAAQVLNDDNSYLMLPPVTGAKYTITVNYTVTTGGVPVTNSITTDPTTIDLSIGTAYTFNLKIGTNSIEFDVNSVADWTPAGSETDVTVN